MSAVQHETSNAARIDDASLAALIDRAVADLSAGYGGVMVRLGDRLGLYRAMAGAGPLTAADVAERANCDERYVREWLNSQVAGRYVDYDEASDRYTLSAESALVLADETSPVFVPNAWQIPASLWADEDRIAEAIRTGAGIPWSEHDSRMACGVAAFFRNGYQASLVDEWLPALAGIVPKLSQGGTVIDVGCGHGHSTLIMASAFPASRFIGIDSDADSIVRANRLAEEMDVASRVEFRLADATTGLGSTADLVCFFDCLHDMGDPVAALREAAAALKDGGSVMAVEPYATDDVGGNVNPVGRLYYAASTAICCAHAISECGPEVLGAQAGEQRLSAIAEAAGFTTFRRVAETPFNLIFEARV